MFIISRQDTFIIRTLKMHYVKNGCVFIIAVYELYWFVICNLSSKMLISHVVIVLKPEV